MAKSDYDLFVVGAGSGGVRAARISAGHGARVAVAEESRLGGTCVNVGCVPKKLLVYAAHFGEDFEDSRGFGWSPGTHEFDWASLIANKNTEIGRLNGIYRGMLEKSGVDLIEGTARVTGANEVTVGGKAYTADYILVACGGWPTIPGIPGGEHAISSNEVFFLDRFPRRVVIVGGGYIAVEFAGIFHGLGAWVRQVYRGPLFLRGFDADVRGTLAAEMKKKGIDLCFNLNVEKIAPVNGGLRAVLTDGTSCEADIVMFATGRLPKTRDLGLDAVGVRLDPKGAVVVNDFSRSSVPSIYAVGDCTDRINLTPVAIREGHAVADTLFNDTPTRPDHINVPSAVFSQPSIGTVGMSEADACAEFGTVEVYKSSFRPMKHTLSGRDESTLMKLIVDPGSDRVVGCHMVGPDAAEIIQGIAIAVKCGATKRQFDSTVGIHPSAAEEFVTMRVKSTEGCASVPV